MVAPEDEIMACLESRVDANETKLDNLTAQLHDLSKSVDYVKESIEQLLKSFGISVEEELLPSEIEDEAHNSESLVFQGEEEMNVTTEIYHIANLELKNPKSANLELKSSTSATSVDLDKEEQSHFQINLGKNEKLEFPTQLINLKRSKANVSVSIHDTLVQFMTGQFNLSHKIRFGSTQSNKCLVLNDFSDLKPPKPPPDYANPNKSIPYSKLDCTNLNHLHLINMYSKCWCSRCAHQMFDEKPESIIRSCFMVKIGYLQICDHIVSDFEMEPNSIYFYEGFKRVPLNPYALENFRITLKALMYLMNFPMADIALVNLLNVIDFEEDSIDLEEEKNISDPLIFKKEADKKDRRDTSDAIVLSLRDEQHEQNVRKQEQEKEVVSKYFTESRNLNWRAHQLLDEILEPNLIGWLATMSSLEGPSVEKLSLMFFSTLMFLLYTLRDQNSHLTDLMVLVRFPSDIITSLISTLTRTRANELELQYAIYETVNVVVRGSSSSGTSQIITQQFPVIITKLENALEFKIFKVYQVSSIYVRMSGELYRVLDDNVLSSYHIIMQVLLRDIANGNLLWSINPQMFLWLGVVTIEMEKHCNKFITHTMSVMQGVVETPTKIDIYDAIYHVVLQPTKALEFLEIMTTTVPQSGTSYAYLLEGWGTEMKLAKAKTTCEKMQIGVGLNP